MTFAGFAVLFLSLSASALQSVSVPSPHRAANDKTANFGQISRKADRARQENRDDDAIRLYQQGLNLEPTWKEGLWYLSTLRYQKEQYSAARDTLRRFVAYDPKAGPGWALLGMSEYQTHEYSRSLDHLQHAMSLGLGDRKDMAQSVFYFVSILLTRFAQYDESMSLLISIVKSGQPTDSLIEPVGLASLRMPLLPTEIPPDRRELIRMAGQGALAMEANHQPEAERLFSSMVAGYPNEPGVHFLYGALLMDARPEDGIREMKRELDIFPFNISARLRLAEEYVKEEKIEEALPLAQMAIKLEPKRASAHMMLGEVLVAKGDIPGGIRELETARDEAPQTIRIRWDLLRAYTAANQGDDAKREKEEIEKLSKAGSAQ
jgi:tetratricopeptide (TPR) repeat protein